jgi:hypothetical protein
MALLAADLTGPTASSLRRPLLPESASGRTAGSMIRAAIASLARANPALGRHLAATTRTGRYCSYTPDPRVPIAWEP